MGRKKKFGEETDFVNVRVPKSKKEIYRKEIKNVVNKLNTNVDEIKEKPKIEIKNEPEIKIKNSDIKKDDKGFQDLREFVKEMARKEKEERNGNLS